MYKLKYIDSIENAPVYDQTKFNYTKQSLLFYPPKGMCGTTPDGVQSEVVFLGPPPTFSGILGPPDQCSFFPVTRKVTRGNHF